MVIRDGEDFEEMDTSRHNCGGEEKERHFRDIDALELPGNYTRLITVMAISMEMALPEFEWEKEHRKGWAMLGEHRYSRR